MIAISDPQIGKDEIRAVISVLNSHHISQGKKVTEAEKIFSEFCGVKYAVACSNGTSALHTALFAAGIGKGDEVITTPFTFVATANSILMVGATPVFVDIDDRTFNIDPKEVVKAISSKTKAIIVVDLYGQPVNYSEINKIARKHKLVVIEDAAQSVNATYKNKKTGSLADIGCFSFYATKNITCGEGGMITTNNKKYYKKAKEFINHGQKIGTMYDYLDIGFNYRMTDIVASILLEQFKKVDLFTKKRQDNAQKYNTALSGLEGIVTPFVAPDRTHVYHQYTIRVTNKFHLNRDKLSDLLLSRGIQTKVYYPKPLFSYFHLKKTSRIFPCPNVKKISKEILSLPVHPSVKSSEIKFIIDTVLNL